MKTPLFKGTCTAIVTPFTDSGIDLEALRALVDWQITSGVSALVASAMRSSNAVSRSGSRGSATNASDRAFASASVACRRTPNRAAF